MRTKITTGRRRSAERGEFSETGGRVISSTVGAAEERYSCLYNNRFGLQAERMDSREEIGVIVEAIGIHPTPHTLKTDSGVSITGT